MDSDALDASRIPRLDENLAIAAIESKELGEKRGVTQMVKFQESESRTGLHTEHWRNLFPDLKGGRDEFGNRLENCLGRA
jgi:hypothetical protein